MTLPFSSLPPGSAQAWWHWPAVTVTAVPGPRTHSWRAWANPQPPHKAELPVFPHLRALWSLRAPPLCLRSTEAARQAKGQGTHAGAAHAVRGRRTRQSLLWGGCVGGQKG